VLACIEKDPNRRPQDAYELLQLVQKCRVRDSWDGDQAKKWWEQHLLELTGPLALPQRPSDVAGGALVIN